PYLLSFPTRRSSDLLPVGRAAGGPLARVRGAEDRRAAGTVGQARAAAGGRVLGRQQLHEEMGADVAVRWADYGEHRAGRRARLADRKSTRLNSSHVA